MLTKAENQGYEQEKKRRKLANTATKIYLLIMYNKLSHIFKMNVCCLYKKYKVILALNCKIVRYNIGQGKRRKKKVLSDCNGTKRKLSNFFFFKKSANFT